jgi:hypothetical protein
LPDEVEVDVGADGGGVEEDEPDVDAEVGLEGKYSQYGATGRAEGVLEDAEGAIGRPRSGEVGVKLTMPSLFAGMPFVRMVKRNSLRPPSRSLEGGPFRRRVSRFVMMLGCGS